jgi:hypothetical protein
MPERTSTCDPHIERESVQVYLHMSRVLSFEVGHGSLNEHLPQCWIGRTDADNALLRWPPRSPYLMPCDFLLQEYFKYTLHRICPRCEDESSPPFQKSIVTICSGYERKWIVGAISKCKEIKIEIKNYRVFLSVCRSHVTFLAPLECTDFLKCVRELWIILYMLTTPKEQSSSSEDNSPSDNDEIPAFYEVWFIIMC